jgi:acetyl-CoA C-acetyltransferase
MVKLGKYCRSVSIIGAGCTPFVDLLNEPDMVGLTEGEFYGYAALEAMEDAGVNPQQIQWYFHGQANPFNTSNYITPNIHVGDWCGMRAKGSAHHSEACCTGFLALDLAVMAVACGKFDLVLSGGVDMGNSLFKAGMPANQRRRFTMPEFNDSLQVIYDRAYTRPLMGGQGRIMDDNADEYAHKYGLSAAQMDDVLNAIAVNNRRNAAHDSLALRQEEFASVAKMAGFSNVMDYLRSDKFNPHVTLYLRATGLEDRAEGAAAVIVCPTEMAGRFTGPGAKQPIEVLGTGNSAIEATQTHLETKATVEAARQVYELTGMSAKDIDIFYTNDFFISSQLLSAENTGFLPAGEGWKYILDGRTCFDGDRPINSNGGRTSFGHAHAASGLADIYEAVKQLRGLCGEREAHVGADKHSPKTALLRGYGGSQNVSATILKVQD